MEVQTQQESSAMALKLFVDLSGEDSSKPLEVMQKRKGTVEDLKELSFEARSAKDYAWYDVETFLNYRVLCNGELEVRVRFAGFDKAEDEWVNVETAVRERSIPLEPSECGMVNIGDLVLCYLDREYYQLYCDAHVVDIQRQTHDDKGCTCVFVVCYDHDYSETYYLKAEVVQKQIDEINRKQLFNELVFTFFANKRCQGPSSKLLKVAFSY
ncbi:hypothetical protein Gorai_005506 [Gossypium raimondii]|uniref:SAWADEE domain-containing protein n=1 Tax=Gossypium raimondii TaxID=29730 RepID=A0A7J8QCI3_GOSRA|nr:hypothetical protein [Gossypium raimondii]